MLEAQAGQFLVNEALPKPLRDYNRVYDQKGLNSVLEVLAKEYPDQYKQVSKKLADLGGEVAYRQGGLTFGLDHLLRPKEADTFIQSLKQKVHEIHSDPKLSPEQRSDQVSRLLQDSRQKIQELSYGTALKANNPLALQASLGFRGDPGSINSMIGADTWYPDASGKPIPIPILKSYAQGLTPFGLFASSFGGRQGVAATKTSTAEAGALNKQITQAAHRVIVSDDTDEGDWYKSDVPRGLPVKVDDPGNVGTLLAHDVGPFKRNTILTPKLIEQMKQQGFEDILVRSPIVGGHADGGIHARDAGIRNKSTLPYKGFVLGVQSGQGIGEPLTQLQLSKKHGGAVGGSRVSGFKFIEAMANPPKEMPFGATHAQDDGRVERIVDNAAGGKDVFINGKKHYVSSDNQLQVKEGDMVEAGDVISDGTPNPREVVKHKGVGEGRNYLLNTLYKSYRENKIGSKMLRRNLEPVVRGIVNHVQLNDFWNGHAPDDVVNYNYLESKWQPRQGSEMRNVSDSIGRYLETPVLHYTVGTKIRPSVVNQLKKFKIDSTLTHAEPPPFTPHMLRATDNLQYDPDWQVRLGGQYLQRGLLDAAHRGMTSSPNSTSFMPALMQGKDITKGLTSQL